MNAKYVKRESYLNFLQRHKDKPIIKVVSGVRRSGKSTLFLLFKQELIDSGVPENHIISVNFENMAFDELRDPQKLYRYLKKLTAEKSMYYIFLDEIQHVQEFERVVDSLFLEDNIDLYITGSNAYFLSGEIATLLSGRYVELAMLPLSFQEYVNWHKQNDRYKTDEAFFNDYLKSSFPYALFTDNDQELLEYLQGLYSTVVLNDIITRLSVQDVQVLEKVLATLFSTIGSLVNTNKLTNTLKSAGAAISNKTVEKYIAGILDSLIMYRAERYDIHGRQLLNSQEKYYVVDIGLRQLILRDHREDFGHIVENIVYLELLRRYQKVYVGKTKKYEVDFVAINDQQEITYYQVALTALDEQVLTRELRSLQSIDDQYPKYLLTLDQLNKTANYDGIKKMNVIDWLLQA